MQKFSKILRFFYILLFIIGFHFIFSVIIGKKSYIILYSIAKKNIWNQDFQSIFGCFLCCLCYCCFLLLMFGKFPFISCDRDLISHLIWYYINIMGINILYVYIIKKKTQFFYLFILCIITTIKKDKTFHFYFIFICLYWLILISVQISSNTSINF